MNLSNYDVQEIEYLVKGFTTGFDIGYNGPKLRQSRAKILPIRVGSRTEMWNKLIKEVKLGRVAGPFDEVPFDNFIQSPIGLVPKAGNKTRLLFHLSYDFGEQMQDKSLNFHTPDEPCSVKYSDLDEAVANCINAKQQQHGRDATSITQVTGAQAVKRPSCHEDSNQNIQFDEMSEYKPIYMGKTDVQSAFRLVPLSRLCFCWLVMAAVSPFTNKLQYFVDKCLPFGASISCAIFQRFSNALKHLINFQSSTSRCVTNYLDDFLFVSYCRNLCNSLITKFLGICQSIGVPIADEKTEWACTRLVFLGILLDGVYMVLGIPKEKRDHAIYLLNCVKDKKKATVRELQSLCGYLNFINRAIYPGRTFTRRMYAKYAIKWDKRQKKGVKRSDRKLLKPYHHVRLDREFKADCAVWLEFLQNSELSRCITKPMVDIDIFQTSKQISYYSDASAGPLLGYGCVFDTKWLYGRWPEGFIKTYKPSIEFLELYALCTGLFTWQNYLRDTRIIIFCDNQAVVSMVNNLTSSCKQCMYLIRLLVLNGLKNNLRVSVHYIKSKDNVLPDALSRIQMERFRREGPHMDVLPYTVHPDLANAEELFIKVLNL